MKIKIFCDSADVKTIRRLNKSAIVEGFTTNPSLMRKAGAKNYESYSKQILKICKKKPISFLQKLLPKSFQIDESFAHSL